MSLSRIPDLPELLDRYMESSGRSKQWITVKDIRTPFPACRVEWTGDLGVPEQDSSRILLLLPVQSSEDRKNSGILLLPTVSSGNILSRNARPGKTIGPPGSKNLSGNPGDGPELMIRILN